MKTYEVTWETKTIYTAIVKAKSRRQAINDIDGAIAQGKLDRPAGIGIQTDIREHLTSDYTAVQVDPETWNTLG